MKLSLVLLLFVFSIGCAHKAEAPAEAPAEPNSEVSRIPAEKVYSENDPEMKSGQLTVWSLQQMAEAKKFTELNKLFNNGRSMNSLPTGYSAGAGARVLALPGAAGRAIDGLTGSKWKGKYFFPTGRHESHGLNRIKKSLTLPLMPVVLMANFSTQLVSSHSLVPDAKSNMVTLNYANPVTHNYPLELLLKGIQVYDLMVAVPGKYGPVYIGKTWIGDYKSNGNFSATNKNQLVAWFFLDFNDEAFKEQARNHWDGSKEYYINGQTN